MALCQALRARFMGAFKFFGADATDWRIMTAMSDGNTEFFSKDYDANQSATQVLAAPGAGFEYVVSNFVGVTAGTTGEGYLMGGNTYATAEIGSGDNGTVTITAAAVGVAANDFTIEVKINETASQALAANKTGDVYTVTLGTDSEGDPDDTKNTATLVAAALDALDDIGAAASGTGATALDEAEAVKNLAGGVEPVKFGVLLASSYVSDTMIPRCVIRCGENCPVKVTTTFGAVRSHIGFNYEIRPVRS